MINLEKAGNRAEVLREFAMENTRRHPLHHFARKFNGIRGVKEDSVSGCQKRTSLARLED